MQLSFFKSVPNAYVMWPFVHMHVHEGTCSSAEQCNVTKAMNVCNLFVVTSRDYGSF